MSSTIKDASLLEPSLQNSLIGTQQPEFSPRKIAEEFASLLLMEMMKSMRATLSNEGLDGEKSSARDTYSALADTEVTRALAKHDGMGLAHFLEQPLNRMVKTIKAQEAWSNAGGGKSLKESWGSADEEA